MAQTIEANPVTAKRPARGTPQYRIRAIAEHLAAANVLAEDQADADLRYLLSDALMYLDEKIKALDTPPANGLSAD